MRKKNTHPLDNTPEKFWAKVDKSDGPDACWIWTGRRTTAGYGGLKWHGRATTAHIVSYRLTYGELPQDKPYTLHKCDNRPCCNPSHLFPGTHVDNMRDMAEKGRSPKRKGEAAPFARLTDDLVITIVARVRSGETETTVAGDAGVSITTVSRIMLGKAWTHLTGISRSSPGKGRGPRDVSGQGRSGWDVYVERSRRHFELHPVTMIRIVK